MNFFLFIWIAFFPFAASGYLYEKIANGNFTSMHVLIVNPQEHLIVPVKADGRETVSALARQYGAVAAINGGFWKENGDPAGILKINGEWLGTPRKPRGAIGWSQGGRKVLMDRVLTNCQLKDGCEIEVIPAETDALEWKQLENIVGGTPLLVKNENVVKDHTSELTLKSFLVNRHPRTAVGVRSSGEWVFVVVDTRFLGLLGGMTINQLAEVMHRLGCIEALNLDGGGSSTMVIEGRVINKPVGKIRENGKKVEAVSDAIMIF